MSTSNTVPIQSKCAGNVILTPSQDEMCTDGGKSQKLGSHNAGCGSKGGGDAQLWCDEQKAALGWPDLCAEVHQVKSISNGCLTGQARSYYNCFQNYWADDNKVPCALGYYTSAECCHKEWCTQPILYSDAYSWCNANYNQPSTLCQTRAGENPEANPSGETPKEVCDNLFVGSNGFCALGDNIATVQECIDYCSGDMNGAQCLSLMQNFCNKYPTHEKCGCLQATKPTLTSDQQFDPDSLVACYTATCTTDVAYKSPTMQGYLKNCPNVCAQVIDLTTTGSYSPILVDNVKMVQNCPSSDVLKFQQILKNAENNTPPPNPIILPPDTSAQDQLKTILMPTALVCGVIIIIFISLVVALNLKK